MQIETQFRNLIVVDVETSGVNPFYHKIMSVAMVPLINSKKPLELYIKQQAPNWQPTALEYFELYRSQWQAEAITSTEACAMIHRYLEADFGEAATLIGHNIGFDVAFLRQLAFQAGLDELPLVSHRAIDTHTLLYLLYLRGEIPAKALSSSGAFQYFGISVPQGERHSALGDAIATRSLFLTLAQHLGLDNLEPN